MIITHKICMDLTRRVLQPPIQVMQNDEYSRELEFLLTANGDPWDIPNGFAAMIRWHRDSDKTGGSYDTLPDGDLAYSKRDNVLTVKLVPQICATPGQVYLTVMLASDSAVAHTFSVVINVCKNPGSQESVPAPEPDVYEQILGEYSMLSARVNNIASLKEGSTTGDAELIDGRVDHTGHVHKNIGSHIREKTSELEKNSVSCNPQEWTREQQAQARKNLGLQEVDEYGNAIFNNSVTARDVCVGSKDTHVRMEGGYDEDTAYMTLAGSEGDEPVRLGGVAEPTHGGHAANKRYVDNAVANAGVGAAVSYEPQNLTKPQQEQARDNIGAISAEEAPTKNLLKDAEWRLGYYAVGGSKVTDPSACTWYTGYCDTVPVNPGDTFTIRYTIPLDMVTNKWFALNLFNENGGFVSRDTTLTPTYEEVDGKAVYSAEYTIPDGVAALAIAARSFATGKPTPTANASDLDVAILADMVFVGTDGVLDGYLLPEIANKDEGKVPTVFDGKWATKHPEAIYANPNVKAINHRGYNSIAPENTLSAYRLSKKKGFTYVECDIKFTSDNVAVLLHDDSVDRTSNGTGAIAELAFEYVRSLDFGSWKSADYAGEQIPTFEEFIQLCKRIGLHPYIHIDGNVPAGACDVLVSTVKRNGMHKKVTWISYSIAWLRGIKKVDEYARLGFLPTNFDESTISAVLELKGDKNEVFVNGVSSMATTDNCALLATNDIPLEVWGTNDAANIAALNPYVSGITADTNRANVVLYDRFGD